MLQGHKEKYSGFHKWAENVGRIASIRGWSSTSNNRYRWCNEENAKGDENALIRLAVNACIQGLNNWPL